MKLESLEELFVDNLKDLYNAENQLIKAIPRLTRAARHAELKSMFEQHLEETRTHAERIEQIFQMLDRPVRGKKCKGMEGIIDEGKELIGQGGEPSVVDAGLIGAAQRVEHYEIAGYGCARTYARQLGHHEAADILQQTLDEEKAADEKLTQLAESLVNVEAVEAPAGGAD